MKRIIITLILVLCPAVFFAQTEKQPAKTKNNFFIVQKGFWYCTNPGFQPTALTEGIQIGDTVRLLGASNAGSAWLKIQLPNRKIAYINTDVLFLYTESISNEPDTAYESYTHALRDLSHWQFWTGFLLFGCVSIYVAFRFKKINNIFLEQNGIISPNRFQKIPYYSIFTALIALPAGLAMVFEGKTVELFITRELSINPGTPDGILFYFNVVRVLGILVVTLGGYWLTIKYPLNSRIRPLSALAFIIALVILYPRGSSLSASLVYFSLIAFFWLIVLIFLESFRAFRKTAWKRALLFSGSMLFTFLFIIQVTLIAVIIGSIMLAVTAWLNSGSGKGDGGTTCPACGCTGWHHSGCFAQKNKGLVYSSAGWGARSGSVV